jgi:hypothetical protein
LLFFAQNFRHGLAPLSRSELTLTSQTSPRIFPFLPLVPSHFNNFGSSEAGH